jgi:hypothetical protein
MARSGYRHYTTKLAPRKPVKYSRIHSSSKPYQFNATKPFRRFPNKRKAGPLPRSPNIYLRAKATRARRRRGLSRYSDRSRNTNSGGHSSY